MRVVLPLLLLLPALPARAECPASPQAIGAQLDEALAAFGEMDVDRFVASHRQATQAIGCADAPIDAGLAAEIHRVQGMAAFIARDADGARDRFRAAVAADSQITIPEDVVAPAHPMAVLFEDARAAGAGERALLLLPGHLKARVDGVDSATRPADRPMLLQLLDAESGSLRLTEYLQSGDEIPAVAPLATEGVAVPDEDPPLPVDQPVGKPPVELPVAPPPTRRAAAPVAMFAGAGVAAIAGAVLYGTALQSRSEHASATSAEQADYWRGRTNRLGTASAVAGGVAVAAGVGGVVSVVF